MRLVVIMTRRGMTYEDEGIERMWIGEDFLRAFHAIHCKLDGNANLRKELQENLLIDGIILNQEHSEASVSESLANIKIVLLLIGNMLLGARSVAIRAEVALFVRVEDNCESRRLDWLVNESNPIDFAKLVVPVCSR